MELKGVEPSTSGVRFQRSPKLSYSPIFILIEFMRNYGFVKSFLHNICANFTKFSSGIFKYFLPKNSPQTKIPHHSSNDEMKKFVFL